MKAKIFYFTLQDEQTREEKLEWFERTRFEEIPFDHITPDQKANWINLTDNDFDSFLPLIDKEVKAGKSQEAVFQLFSAGVKTQRDEWVYDFSKDALIERMKYFVEVYSDRLEKGERRELDIKWDRELDKYFERSIKKKLETRNIIPGLYRYFTKMYFYFDKHFNGMNYQMFNIFPSSNSENKLIGFMGQPAGKAFSVIATDLVPDLNCISPASGGIQCLPLYRYGAKGDRIENITDWALERFRQRYLPSPPQPSSPAGEEGAGSKFNHPSPAGEGPGVRANLQTQPAAGINYPSPAGEGRGVRANLQTQPQAGINHPSPAGEVPGVRANLQTQPAAGINHPSPAGEGPGGKVTSPAGEGLEGKASDLVYLAGARREIPQALLQRARELRQLQTSAEKILWECLRANRLNGAKFRRQHNIGQYIADFYCSAAKLVVELDGEIHQTQQERDGDRDAWMQANGLTVLRFNNTEITENLEQTLQAIADHLPSPPQPSSPAGEEGARTNHPSPATDLPSPAGEGLGVRAHSPAGEGLGVRAHSPVEEGLGVRAITKLDIFHYTYAVLHHPAYRTKYELNLKREFPRLPFYANFHQWATWGKDLMDLHLNYETVEPYELKRVDKGRVRTHGCAPLQGSLLETDAPDPAKPIKRTTPKAKLKADKTEGKIILDTETTLEGVPALAWEYKLGNRSALEWILDQYKEKTPKDPTIAKLFNTYKFADYKEHVIDLLQRVCTVSVRTMEIIQQMPDTVEHQALE